MARLRAFTNPHDLYVNAMSDPAPHGELEQLLELVTRALAMADDMELLEAGIALDSARHHVEAALEALGPKGLH